MKTTTLAILATLALCSCAGQQQLTPEQVTAYSNTAHSTLQNGVADYKALKPILSR